MKKVILLLSILPLSTFAVNVAFNAGLLNNNTPVGSLSIAQDIFKSSGYALGAGVEYILPFERENVPGNSDIRNIFEYAQFNYKNYIGKVSVGVNTAGSFDRAGISFGVNVGYNFSSNVMGVSYKNYSSTSASNDDARYSVSSLFISHYF